MNIWLKQAMFGLCVFFVAVLSDASDLTESAEFIEFSEFTRTMNPKRNYDGHPPYEGRSELWIPRNPRLIKLSVSTAKKYTEEFLISVLEDFDPDSSSTGHHDAACLAADALGLSESKNVQTVLLKRLSSLPEEFYLRRCVMNSLTFRVDSDKKVVEAFIKTISTSKEGTFEIFGLESLVICSAYSPEVKGDVVGFLEDVALGEILDGEWRCYALKMLVKAGEEPRAVVLAVNMLKNSEEKTQILGRYAIMKLGYFKSISKLKKDLNEENIDLQSVSAVLKGVGRNERMAAKSWRITFREKMANEHAAKLKENLKNLPKVRKNKKDFDKIEGELLTHINELRRLKCDSEKTPVLQIIEESKDISKPVRDAVVAAKMAISDHKKKH